MADCRQLHRDKTVVFAGYRIPHPLEYQMVVKVGGAVCRAVLQESILLNAQHGAGATTQSWSTACSVLGWLR